MSEDFFASQFLHDVECKLTLQRKKSGEAEIIPVVLSGKTLQQHQWLKVLQLTPRQPGSLTLGPLLDFQPRQAKGWEVVQEQLRKVIAEMRSRRRKSPGALHSSRE